MDDKDKNEQEAYREQESFNSTAPVLCHVLGIMEGDRNDTGHVGVHSDILFPMR